MAELGGPMRGRSTIARLALAGTDPSFPLVLAPHQAWWKAAWEDLLPREVLACAPRRAARNAREAGHLMHAHAEGGVGAFVSAMARIGWRAILVDTYLLASGITLKLGQDCDPRMLKALAMADLEEVIAAQSGLSEELSSIDKADGFHRATSRASGFQPLGTPARLARGGTAEVVGRVSAPKRTPGAVDETSHRCNAICEGERSQSSCLVLI